MQLLETKQINKATLDLNNYIQDSLSEKLASFTFQNETIITLAKWLRRHATGSPSTLHYCISNTVPEVLARWRAPEMEHCVTPVIIQEKNQCEA